MSKAVEVHVEGLPWRRLGIVAAVLAFLAAFFSSSQSGAFLFIVAGVLMLASALWPRRKLIPPKEAAS